MKKLIVLLGLMTGIITALAVAAPAFAQEAAPGFVEVCKAVGTPAVAGPFTFTVTDSAGATTPVTVNAGGCSAPIAVAVGNVNIAENLTPVMTVTDINTSAPGALNDALVTSDLSAGTATVNVADSGIVNDVVVNYTDILATGQIEICKNQVTGAMLDGQVFNFEVTGGINAVTGNAQSDQVVGVTVGNCSAPITVPAGTVYVSEINDPADRDNPGVPATGDETGNGLMDPVYVTGLSLLGGSGGSITSSNLTEGQATLDIPAGTTANETVLNYTDNSSFLKVCKQAGPNAADAGIVGTNFTFTASPGPLGGGSGTATVAAGPNGAPNCAIIGRYRAGTPVTVSEAPTAGLATSASLVQDQETVNDQSPPYPAMSGNDFTGVSEAFTIAPGGNVLTWTNSLGIAALLKVCKVGGPATSTFTVSGPRFPLSGPLFPLTTGTSTLTIASGNCAFVLDAKGQPLYLPYASLQTITQNVASGFSVTAIAFDPAANLASSNLGGGSAQAFIGGGGQNVDIATFTDPAHATAPAPSSKPSSSGSTSSSSASSSSSSSSASSSSSSSNSTSSSTAKPSTSGPSAAPSGTPTSTPSSFKPTKHVRKHVTKHVKKHVKKHAKAKHHH